MSARTHIVLPILKYYEQKLSFKYGNVTVTYRLLQGISKYIHTIYERYFLQLFVIATSHIKMKHDSKFPVMHWTLLWIWETLSILMDHLHIAKKWYPQKGMYHSFFLHDRPWISPWIKSISNELDITCHVFVSQLPGHCDVIANPLWRHQQNVKRAREKRGWCVKILVLVSFMDSLCRVRNKIMYVLLWRTVYALTRVLYRCLFPSLLRNSGNQHQNNPLVSA